jgi:hypothetical protein
MQICLVTPALQIFNIGKSDKNVAFNAEKRFMVQTK